MKNSSIARRLVRLVQRLPESAANSVRFRVPFLLPRWFRAPRRIRILRETKELRIPINESVESEFIECFLLNAYGLGNRLGEVHSILDIGANVGFFALAARARYPDAAIHAYEPNPRVLPCLDANSKGLNISVFPEAAGGEECFVTMIDEGPSDEARTRRAADSQGSIRQITLATAIDRIGGSVDLLKMDCEGAEWEILNSDGCWRAIRHIRMEIHFFNGETVDQARAAVERIGFKILQLDAKSDDMAIIWASRA